MGPLNIKWHHMCIQPFRPQDISIITRSRLSLISETSIFDTLRQPICTHPLLSARKHLRMRTKSKGDLTLKHENGSAFDVNCICYYDGSRETRSWDCTRPPFLFVSRGF